MQIFGKKVLFSLTFLLFFTVTSAGAGGTIQGKVSYKEKGLADATVLLYKVASERVSGQADYQVEKTSEDGSFEILVVS